MRICKLLASHPVFDMRVYHKEALSLKAAGHRITLLASGGTGTEITEDGVYVHYFTRRRRTLSGVTTVLRRLLSLISLYRVAVRTPADVYHCHEPDSWLVGIIAKLTTGRRVVFDVHEHFPSVVADRFPIPLGSLVERLGIAAMRAMCRFTDHLILTDEEFEDAIFEGIPTPKTLVLNGSTYKSGSRDQRAILRAEHGYSDDDFLLVFVGRMKETESVNSILEALARCVRLNRQVKCIFVGGFFAHGKASDDHKRKYEEMIFQLHMQSHIEVTGWLPFGKVEPYLHMADAGLFLRSSVRKNAQFGPAHKLFDYMATGLPIIASESVGYTRIIEHWNCGVLVDPNNPEEISQVILHLCKNPDAAARMGANGREAHEKYYSWDIQAQRLVSAYASL